MQDKFIARTRKRGEISYYDARWQKNNKGLFEVTFLNGPHKGESYEATHVGIAKKEWR